MSDERLRVILCWHMHQPDYCDPVRGEYELPWTYLHAIKDYVDMIAHIESQPDARAVFNFSPILLRQLADYASQLTEPVHDPARIRDPLLAALVRPVQASSVEHRRALIHTCLQSNEQHIIARFASYGRLVGLGRWALEHPDGLRYLDDAFIVDLLVWYHLAWLGETVKRSDRRVIHLMEKAAHYTLADRILLLQIIAELITDLLPRYRAMADAGRIELSHSPFTHPIMPLLLDFGSALEAMPGAVLPASPEYPGGERSCELQVEEGKKTFAEHFGAAAKGCWPSEGAICDRSVGLLDRFGIRWIASGQQVLRHSLGDAHPPSDARHRPYTINGSSLACFFRDDEISDLIGFTYKTWHADDAVADVIRRLRAIAAEPGGGGRVVAIVLDGENPWDHYPENGFHFLRGLYKELVNAPDLELTTFARCVDDPSVPVRNLDHLVAGSWVYGTLSTWIGEPDKNRAWDMLVAAKQRFDAIVSAETGADMDAAVYRMAICEASDWFWWPGPYNPEAAVEEFDRLFRVHLASLYQALGEVAPDQLSMPFTHGGGHPEAGGTMRPSH